MWGVKRADNHFRARSDARGGMCGLCRILDIFVRSDPGECLFD